MQALAEKKQKNTTQFQVKTAQTATLTQNSVTATGCYGARYLDPKTSRWISADPAMYQGDYIPLAPINDEAKKRNKNLPGMGNNPVKLVDPDGKWFGMKEILIQRKNAIRDAFYDIDNATSRKGYELGNLKLEIVRKNNPNDINMVLISSKALAVKLGLKDKQAEDYKDKEIERYSKFLEISQRSLEDYNKTTNILEEAVKLEKSIYDKTNPRKNDMDSYKKTEQEVNKLIDDFIRKYDPDYNPIENND